MKKLFATLALGLFALPAFADGFYVAGDLGRDRWTSDINDNSKSSNIFSVAAGYEFRLAFHDRIGLEIGYRDLGNTEESNNLIALKTNVTASQFCVVASHDFSDQISLYGRLGYADIEMDSKIHKAEGNSDVTTSYDKVVAGVGGRYMFDEHLGVRLEYDRYDDINDIVISSLMVGAEYHF